MKRRPSAVSPLFLSCLLALCSVLTARAQEYSSSFNAVRMPVSSHVAALGGQNVTLIEDSPMAGWANPALYANVSDLSIGLSFMTYTAGGTWTGAHFTKAFGERHTLALAAQYMGYGATDETDDDGNVLGTFHPKDIVIGAGYSYLLSDRWSGGASLKSIVSNLADYSSVAIAVDVGVNYYDEENDFSASAALQNVGTQLKAYDTHLRTHLPLTLVLGFSKAMAHLPVRFHVTMTDVTRWKSSYYVSGNAEDEKVSFAKKALNHFLLGIDVIPVERFYLSLGYNFRRANELKAAGSSHWAGITAGAGLQLSRFGLGLSYAQYHRAGNSVMASATYRL